MMAYENKNSLIKYHAMKVYNAQNVHINNWLMAGDGNVLFIKLSVISNWCLVVCLG